MKLRCYAIPLLLLGVKCSRLLSAEVHPDEDKKISRGCWWGNYWTSDNYKMMKKIRE